ncbi:MAG TPA: STAS domain-containing protein [Trebonia sp.]|jgi:anti-sigma B factor antagonist|nr:STAS domain-containing protein [Trebonia sp.]
MQPFNLETAAAGADGAVLRVSGEVDVYTAPQLRDRVVKLVDDGVRHVIIDLQEVTFLDSTGLGALVGSLKRLREHDGSLKLVTTAGRITQLLRLTQLDKAFVVHESVPAAMADERG